MLEAREELSVLIVSCRQDYQKAKQLADVLKRYRIPKKLLGEVNRDGKQAANVDEVFINLEQAYELSSPYLNARYAVVLCSPDAVEAAEVDRWVRAYKQKNGSSKVLCYILSGEPNAADRPDSGLHLSLIHI